MNVSVNDVMLISSRLYTHFSRVCARERCRICPPHFLAECCKNRLNQASFIPLYFVLFAFSGFCLVFVVSAFNVSSVVYFPVCTNVNGTVVCSLIVLMCR